VSDAMIAAILTGLRVKKETIDEIAGAATVMREFARPVAVADKANLVDIVGTGGDGSHTFNISTCAMFVAAAAGARVAKHGNRSVSSKSGSADALEALGAVIELQPDQVGEVMARTGLGFMFAPIHHPAMKVVAPVRREMGVRTLFNILGPLTNPAGAPNILMGVFHPDLVGIQARVLHKLGAAGPRARWWCGGATGWTRFRSARGRWSGNCVMVKFASMRFTRRISALRCRQAAILKLMGRKARLHCCARCWLGSLARRWMWWRSTPGRRYMWRALRVRLPMVWTRRAR